MPCEIYSQGISNLWMMGYSSGTIYPQFGGTNIDFYNGYPDTSTVNRDMNFSQCNANICDDNGNLLFYTNGVYIANSNNDTMLNGQGLNPSAYTTSEGDYGLMIKQGNLILPLPSNPTIYYLFHETLYYLPNIGDERTLEIYYSVIDMSLEGGLGAVVQKNNVLLSDTLTIGAITACKHANGRDWWIVFHRYTGKTYFKYLLTPSGLQGPFMQDIGTSLSMIDWVWQSCFSPDGKKFASVMARDSLDVMDFDRCTGMFSNCRSVLINDSANARGVAFSGNSVFLYVSSTVYVYQFNSNFLNLDSSKFLVAIYDGFADPIPPSRSAFFLSQLANDGKIYINAGNTTPWLHVINNPDLPGSSCNMVQHGFMLPTENAFTLPNFPNFFLDADSGSICDSLQSIVSFTSDEKKCIVFPNPCNRVLYVSNIPENYSVHLFNPFGEKIEAEKKFIQGHYIEVNTSSLISGVYIIEIKGPNGRITKRFIKE